MQRKKNKPIGLIDSGVGGLTVAKAVRAQLPHESILYLGDNARCPYGTRSQEEILSYTFELADFLLQEGIKFLVVACNTATAVALEELQAQLPIPVLGVIESGVQEALVDKNQPHIGVLATPATIKSQVYTKQIKEANPQATVTGLACPGLVTLVERGNLQTPATYQAVARELIPLKNKNLDAVIMGCTHFPLIEAEIQAALGDQVALVDAGRATVHTLAQALLDYDLEAPQDQVGEAIYYTTGSPDHFYQIASSWFEDSSLDIRQLQLKGESE